jgi:condensin complex subunit 3
LLTVQTEEEKKILAPLLGKLHVSPASTEVKIREVYAEVSDAVQSGLVTDATGRNALYKIHVSLGKIVNNLDAATAAAGPRLGRRSLSAALEDRTERTVVSPEAEIKEEEEEEVEKSGAGEETTGVEETTGAEETGVEESVIEGTVAGTEAEDSIVDELLDDDGDTVMG